MIQRQHETKDSESILNEQIQILKSDCVIKILKI